MALIRVSPPIRHSVLSPLPFPATDEALNTTNYVDYFWMGIVRQFELHTTIVDNEV